MRMPKLASAYCEIPFSIPSGEQSRGGDCGVATLTGLLGVAVLPGDVASLCLDGEVEHDDDFAYGCEVG